MGRNVDKTRDLVEVKPNPEKRYSKYKDLNSKVIKYAHLDTPEIHEEICDRIVNGQAITAICKLEHMPHLELVYKWSSDPEHPMFARYERAVRIRAERWVDEILAIADDTTNDLIVDEMGGITGERKNSFLKKHNKKPDFLPQLNMVKNNSFKTPISSLGLFEQIERIKNLM